jgi:hypothetical protein
MENPMLLPQYINEKASLRLSGGATSATSALMMGQVPFSSQDSRPVVHVAQLAAYDQSERRHHRNDRHEDSGPRFVVSHLHRQHHGEERPDERACRDHEAYREQCPYVGGKPSVGIGRDCNTH